jgi:hypothetical protein
MLILDLIQKNDAHFSKAKTFSGHLIIRKRLGIQRNRPQWCFEMGLEGVWRWQVDNFTVGAIHESPLLGVRWRDALPCISLATFSHEIH